MVKQTRRGSTPAVRALTAAGVPHRLHEYRHDPAVASYGLEAAQALGVEPARVYKTLVVQVDGEPTLAVGVVPVDRQLDLKSLAAAIGAKRVQLAPASTAERATGYVVGGISPLGQRQRLRTVIDETATGQESVFVSAGRRGFDVELAPEDLVTITGAVVAPVAR